MPLALFFLAIEHIDAYIIAAISGFIGACVGFLGTWILEWRRRVNERKAADAAVMAEIEAILQIVGFRNYQPLLSANIALMTRTGRPAQLKVPIRENLMPVYTAHVEKLGLLPHPLPSNLALLHTLAVGIKEDLQTLCEAPDRAGTTSARATQGRRKPPRKSSVSRLKLSSRVTDFSARVGLCSRWIITSQAPSSGKLWARPTSRSLA
jgi:hypothetical protein